jgi:hypothetical protein
VDLALEDPALGQELLQDRQRLVEVVVQGALHPALLEQGPADRRVPLDLTPESRLLIEGGGYGQVPEVEIRSQVAHRHSIAPHQLQGGEGGAPLT